MRPVGVRVVRVVRMVRVVRVVRVRVRGRWWRRHGADVRNPAGVCGLNGKATAAQELLVVCELEAIRHTLINEAATEAMDGIR